MDMEWKTAGEKLPKQPGESLAHEIMMDIYDSGELGDNLILYHREAVTLREELRDIMNAEDWERRERTARRRWGARCTCTSCGEDFIAGYIRGNGRRGIVLAEGEDGQTYEGYAEPGAGANKYLDGETMLCPRCWNSGQVTPRAELRQGRTYQALQAEVVNVEAYTAVMYWLVSRYVDGAGYDRVLFYPYAALLIDLDGKLRRFRAKRTGNEVREIVWTPCAASRDPMQIAYYSWEAANHRKVGGWTYAAGPPLDGHTGEKTALEQYIGAGGCWPGAYLHVWQRHPQVENLMRQGFASAVYQAIDDRLGQASTRQDLRDAPPIPWVDWREVKPHRMLGMDKAAFREISKKTWSAEIAACWDRYRCQLPGAGAAAFEACREKIGVKAIGQLLEMVAAGWEDLTPLRVTRYLEKQQMLKDGVQHLIDYRKMLRDARMDETAETLWPRSLMTAHERLTQYWAQYHKTSYQLGFTSAYIQYRDLEWTDGELCVVVPKVEQQLADEGKVLRHCVGTYGSAHCAGKPIFFVRHYRRPERSYYTLQIDMTGRGPKEIQLHGYGNERHGANKQHRHQIPQKVRNFCDRWEREILTPWFAERRKENAAKKATGKRRTA